MASLLQAKSLGWQKLVYTNTTNLDNFPVRVRRQDSTIENVMLMDELTRFLDTEIPEAVGKYLAYPQFKYNQEALNHIQGFPEEARTRFSVQRGPKDREQMLKEHWRQRALGDSSEAKTVRALETLFQTRPSLLLTGVKAERILQLARQSAKHSFNQSRVQDPHLFTVPLTKEERMLFEALGFGVLELENQIKDLLALTPQTTSISRNNLLAAVNSKSVRPGFQLLSDAEKSQYIKTLTREVNQMFNKSKRDLSPDEVANHLTRFFLNMVEKKDEFDLLLADRLSSTILQGGGEKLSPGWSS